MASVFNKNGPNDSRTEEASASNSRSFADAVARSSTSERRGSSQTEMNETGERRNKNFVSKFVTPPPQGSLRDKIVVEIQKINEQDSLAN